MLNMNRVSAFERDFRPARWFAINNVAAVRFARKRVVRLKHSAVLCRNHLHFLLRRKRERSSIFLLDQMHTAYRAGWAVF